MDPKEKWEDTANYKDTARRDDRRGDDRLGGDSPRDWNRDRSDRGDSTRDRYRDSADYRDRDRGSRDRRYDLNTNDRRSRGDAYDAISTSGTVDDRSVRQLHSSYHYPQQSSGSFDRKHY